jgi:hypothetical protein
MIFDLLERESHHTVAKTFETVRNTHPAYLSAEEDDNEMQESLDYISNRLRMSTLEAIDQCTKLVKSRPKLRSPPPH